MDGRAAGHNFERGPSKFGLNWLCFLRKRLKCEKLTTDDDGWTTDDERNLMVKVHMAYGQVS